MRSLARRLVAIALIGFGASVIGRDAHAAIVERTVARFLDPEASSSSTALRFVMLRELVIESWMAMYDRTAGNAPSSLDDKTVRSAFERHVVEALLGERALPASVEAQVKAYADDARKIAVVEVGGDARLKQLLVRATGSEKGAEAELDSIFRRRARAELYLEVAVTQTVRASDGELRAAYSRAPEELTKLSYEAALPLLRIYVRTVRLRAVAQSYYQAVRSRLRLENLTDLRNHMALSELPPAPDDSGEPGAEKPLVRTPPPGAMSRAWLGRLQGIDAPWTEARRARRTELTGLDFAPIVLQSAKGSNVVDLDGNRYVDMAAAFGAALVGHGNSRVVRTLEMQLERLMFGLGDVYPTDAKIGLTERLARLFPEPGARVMLGLSGSDAIDAAMKTAVLATGRPGILAFEGAYHGLATGPLAACGLRPEYRAPFAAHLSKHVRFVPYPSRPRRRQPARADVLDQALTTVDAQCKSGEMGAILVEPVLGRGGVVIPPEGFLKGLREICDRTGTLLVADEIWTGLGRSGSLLRSVDEGAVPDLVCLGKGLGGGVPMSACIGRGRVMDAWRTPKGREVDDEAQGPSGEAIHTSTYAGSPVACAMAIAMLDSVIGAKLVQRSREEGEALLKALDEALGDDAHVLDVRGAGLMIGVELEGGAARGLGLMHDLLAKGYIVLTGGAGDVLTLTPPLNIARPLLDGFVEAIGELARQRAV